MLMGGNGNSNGHKRNVPWRWSGKRPGLEEEAFRRLALQLHYDFGGPGEERSVLLATPMPSELCARGGTLLACALADELRQPVLLVDASPRRGELAALIQSPEAAGFTDMLADSSLRIESLVMPTSHPHVAFLCSGNSAPPASDAASVLAVLAQAAANYRFAIFAGGSVLNDSLTRAVAPHAGCVLLLGVENETMVNDLDAAQNALHYGKARKVALVLTNSG